MGTQESLDIDETLSIVIHNLTERLTISNTSLASLKIKHQLLFCIRIKSLDYSMHSCVCAHEIMPPRGIRSGGNKKVSINTCGNILASAVVAAKMSTELAPINATVTSNQAKALK